VSPNNAHPHLSVPPRQKPAMRFITTSMITLLLGAESILLNTGGVRHSHAGEQKFRPISIPFEETVAAVSNITDLPANLSTGHLLAYEPFSPQNDDVFVFLPGSQGPCESYSDFLEVIAEDMYTLCLPYDNRDMIMRLCTGKPIDCPEKLRSAAYDGDFRGIEDNNQHDRLASALKYLSKNDSPAWAKYLDADGSPKRSSMRVGGHSQGAGSAAWIGYKQKVNRVVQISGPCDPVNWTAVGPPETPPSRFYSLGHQLDVICPSQFKLWEKEGVDKTVTTTNFTIPARSTLYGMNAQSVVSTIPPLSCGPKSNCQFAPHASVLSNGFWLGSNPYADLWKFLVGI